MLAKVISFEQWKRNHPPALIFWQQGLAAALAWQQLWIKVIYGPFRK